MESRVCDGSKDLEGLQPGSDFRPHVSGRQL